MASQPWRSYKGQTQLTQPQLETGLNVHGTGTLFCVWSVGGEKLNEMGNQKGRLHGSKWSIQGYILTTPCLKIWNRMRPRVLVQNQHTRELISAQNM